MSDRKKALLLILAGAFLGGAVTTVTKIGLVGIPPITFAFLRFFLASILIAPLAFNKKNKLSINILKSLLPFSLFATLNIVVFILGIRTTTATIGQLLYAGVPFLVGLITFIIFNERLSHKKIIGIIIGFLGVGFVVFLPVLTKGERFSGDLMGNLLIAAGVVSWSVYMVFSKRVSKMYSPIFINSAFIFITTLVLFPFFIFDIARDSNWVHEINLSSIFSIIYVAVFGTVINYLLNQYAIKYGGSVLASMSFYLLPIFAFLSAYLLLGEKLTLGLILGGSLALVGIVLVTSKK